jgi:hypothetical protein
MLTRKAAMTATLPPRAARTPKIKMYEQISPLGTDVVEKFFVSNAALLLPE